jgi:hypothetical protein
MSEPSKPAGTPTPKPRAAYGNPSMRISDAERAEVSDRLSQHFSDGRLDEAEFGKRLDQAMHAVTQSDLAGLFDDLPDGAAGHGGPADRGRTAPDRSRRSAAGAEYPDWAPRSRRRGSRVLMLAVLIVIAVIVSHALTHFFLPAVVIAVVAVLWLRRNPSRRHHHHHTTPEA